jgi:hypothetical protein
MHAGGCTKSTAGDQTVVRTIGYPPLPGEMAEGLQCWQTGSVGWPGGGFVGLAACAAQQHVAEDALGILQCVESTPAAYVQAHRQEAADQISRVATEISRNLQPCMD